MKHYLGGYFLFRLKPFDWSPVSDVYTATNCLNEHLLGLWSYSWTTKTEPTNETFGLNEDRIEGLRRWVDQQHRAGKIGWLNVFADLNTARAYQRTFFPQLDGVKTVALYVAEPTADEIIRALTPASKGWGEAGLYQTLLKKTPEIDSLNELVIGYDLIGLEPGGDFHSFHCHGIGAELAERFGLTLNRYGLFDDCADWTPVLNALNNGEIGAEPVPWYVAKMKLLAPLEARQSFT